MSTASRRLGHAPQAIAYRGLGAGFGSALAVIAVAGCALLQPGKGSRIESVVIPFIAEGDVPVWVIGHHDEDQMMGVWEFVRPGQTVNDWTELLTVLKFHNVNSLNLGTVDEMVDRHGRDLARRCPGSTQDVVRRLANGVLCESRAVNCPTGADEHILTRVIDGMVARFAVSYSVRGEVAMTAERRAEWIERLQTLTILSQSQ